MSGHQSPRLSCLVHSAAPGSSRRQSLPPAACAACRAEGTGLLDQSAPTHQPPAMAGCGRAGTS
eukprot:8347639-Pyramimonas_sp.AAC.1